MAPAKDPEMVHGWALKWGLWRAPGSGQAWGLETAPAKDLQRVPGRGLERVPGKGLHAARRAQHATRIRGNPSVTSTAP